MNSLRPWRVVTLPVSAGDCGGSADEAVPGNSARLLLMLETQHAKTKVPQRVYNLLPEQSQIITSVTPCVLEQTFWLQGDCD